MRTSPFVLDELESRQMFDTLTAGVTVATSVTTARPQKNWSIVLRAGQAIMVALGETATSAFQPELVLINPKHKAMARSSGDAGAFISKVAPIAGTYIVRILDVTGTHTSPVQVTAVFTGSTVITDGDDGGVAQSGRRFPATISPGDLDVWEIDATAAKQFLTVVANENSNGSTIGVGVALLGPDGTGITSKESDTGFAIDEPNLAKGTYYAVVYEPGADATGRYGFSIGLSPGPQTTEDPDTQTPLVSSTTPRTGDLPSGDLDLYQATIAAGKTATVTVARNGSTVTPNIQIIDPSGNLIKTISGTSTATVSFTTTVAGQYSIVLRNRDADTGGTYKLTYTVA